MTKTELYELIAQGENSSIEFKSDIIDNRDLAKELVGLVNFRGGHLLLGVEDDGSVSGLVRQDPAEPDDRRERRTYRKFEERVVQACRDKIRPEIIPHFEIIPDVEPGRDVAVLHVERGWTVHHLWHNQHRTYYIRVGSINREASPEELVRMFQQRGALRLELQPISGTSIADLDRRRLVDYFERVRGQEVPAASPFNTWRQEVEAWAKSQDEKRWRALAEDREREWRAAQEADWESLLVNTDLLHEDMPHSATVAGLMLFGRDPSRILPHAKIDAAAYFGTEKDYKAKERITLRGPIPPLQGRDGTPLEPGLVEQAMAFIRRNIDTVRLEDGVRRRERWDYPPDALRETIVNAIVHRDYSLSGTDIEISIYADRLEVISPGRLPNGITPERMRVGCRSARNELLKDVMRDYGYLEHMGMGVPRKIVRGMKEHNDTEPDLVEEGERFTVRLWKDRPA